MIEFAVAEEDVRVRVGGHRERPLPYAGADQRPGLALSVPKADSSVAQVVRRPSKRARGLAGTRDRRSQPLLGQPGEYGLVRAPVLARRKRRDDGGEEVGREGDPAAAAALLDGAADAPAGVPLIQVAATQPFLLELADAHVRRVEHKHRQRVAARHQRQDGLDLLGRGWCRLFTLLTGEPHVDAVAGRVVLHAGEVEHLGEDAEALADRLPLPTRDMERSDELGDVARRDLIDAARAKEREDAAELNAMPDRGSVRDVDPRGTPAFGRLGERRRRGWCAEVVHRRTRAPAKWYARDRKAILGKMSLEIADGTASQVQREKLRDPRAMRALAHPLRLTLLDLITREGQLTSTRASQLTGESTANCSFHLRQLAKYGFVEETEGGDRRERPWRLAPVEASWSGDHPDLEAAVAVDALTADVIEGNLAARQLSFF